MSKVVKARQPCPSDACNSSDAYFVYEDGSGYCFSCSRYTPPNGVGTTHSTYGYDFLPVRGLTKATCSRYKILSKYDEEGNVSTTSFPYHKGAGFKVRDLTKPKAQQFSTTGDMAGPGLFGEEAFPPGCAKTITVTEGEYDAPSVFQMLGEKNRWTHPAVSVKSSATAKRDCAGKLGYLNSFEHIYLCFDNDPVGQGPVGDVASLFDPKRVFHVKLDRFKDANDYLKAYTDGDETALKSFKNAWWNAKIYTPDNIVSSFSDVDKLLDVSTPISIASYPWSVLQEHTKGIRSKEIILFTALEGIGKTEIVRALEYHLLKNTNEKIAIIHLEETTSRAIRGLVGYDLSVPCHLSNSIVDNDKLKSVYRDLCGSDDRVYFFDHFGSTDPEQILKAIRFLVSACGCKFVFLDHITMVVSGLVGSNDERKILDYLSTQLVMLTKELDFTLFLVSHVNDDGLTRGSRNISKIAHTHIALERDLYEADPTKRNTTRLTIRKNRDASVTGPSSNLYFDPVSFTVSELQ